MYFRVAIICISMGAFIGGCTATHSLHPGEEIALKERAEIQTRDSLSYHSYDISTRGDSIYASELKSARLLRFHKSEVDKIIVPNRTKGALLGGVLGAVVPTATILFIIWDSDYPFFPTYVGLAGGVLGSMVGAKVAVKDQIRFSNFEGELHTTLKDSADNILTYPSPISIKQQKYFTKFWDFSNPRNQIAGNLFLYFGDAPVKGVFGFSARRYIKQDWIINFLPKFLTGPYIHYSYRYAEGTSFEGFDAYHWHADYNMLSLGYTPYWFEKLGNGRAGFIEAGLVNGWMHESGDSGITDRIGYGVVSSVGLRIWSHVLFGELQCSFDTLTRHFIPFLVAGLRF